MTERLREVDANLLLFLHALLEERSLTLAGERLRLSQPAMSGGLARLRKHFDDELLVRRGREFHLTELAEELRPEVAVAVESAEGLIGAHREFEPGESTRRFTMTLSDYAMIVLAKPLIRAIRERAPDCSISLDTFPGTRAQLEGHEQRRDLVVAPVGFGLAGRQQPVFTDELVCIVDKKNPRIKNGSLDRDALLNMPHAVAEFLDPEQHNRRHNQVLEAALEAIGITEPRAQVKVASLLTLPYAISGTEICAFIPARLARRCADALDLTVVQTPLDRVEFVEAAHWHPRRENEPAGVWLRRLLYDVAIEVEDDV